MPSKLKRRGSPGRPYKNDVVREAMRLLRERERFPKKHSLTYRAIANRAGVWSHATIHNWANRNMRERERKKRILKRGHKRLLSHREERIIAGYIILRSINSLSATSRDVRLFVLEAFGIHAKPTWLKDWASRNHLSWKRPQRRTFGRPLRGQEEKLVKFLEEIRSLRKEPRQIACIDKVYFQSQAVAGRQLSMVGAGTPKLDAIKRSFTDCLYVMLVADGTVGPFYYSTKDKNFAEPKFGHEFGFVDTQSKGRGFGEESFITYLQLCLNRNYLQSGDLLLLDNERSFSTKKVSDLLTKKGIIIKHFPVSLGSIANPCDNSFNAELKELFYQEMAFTTNSSTQNKMGIAEKCFWQISEQSVENYFRHCGIIGHKYREQVRRIIREGMIPSSQYTSLHRDQISQFLKWAKANKFNVAQFEIKRLPKVTDKKK